MDLQKITYAALGNLVELTLTAEGEGSAPRIDGTLMAVKHSIYSSRGRRDISTALTVKVGQNELSIGNDEVSEIHTYDESGTRLRL